MLKTNSKAHMLNVKNFIIGNISDDVNDKNESEQLQFIIDDINRVTDNETSRRENPNNQLRISAYLQGIPFYFIASSSYEILEQYKQFTEQPDNVAMTAKLEDKVINNYYNFMALMIMRVTKHNF